MIKVKLHSLAGIFYLHHTACVLPRTIWRGKLYDIAHFVSFISVAQFIEQLARYPLHQLGVAFAKGNASGQLKRRLRAFRQTHQVLLN